MWAHSSVWIEWLPAEQLVVGSNPSEPVVFKFYGNLGNKEKPQVNYNNKESISLYLSTSNIYFILVTILADLSFYNFLANEYPYK